MEQRGPEFALEVAHLDMVRGVVAEQLADVQANLQGKEALVAAARQAMLDRNMTDDMGDLYSAQGFHDLVEQSQATQVLEEEVGDYDGEVRRALTYQRMLDTPYFARVMMRFAGESEVEAVYIGRGSLISKDFGMAYVYDWRAPVSSVFYRHGLGPVSYQAPGGTVHGEVSGKRQYEIRQGALHYYFDADVQIADEFLRRALSQNASPHMKTIVETIQADQDRIIRDVQHQLVMVQGVAGSGKTSVALHRVAYLMYQGLGSHLTARHIAILSPNALFAHYVARVLPELGEQNVETLTMEEVYEGLFPGARLQSRNGYLEQRMAQSDARLRERQACALAFKTSATFAEILRRYVGQLAQEGVEYQDVWYAGDCLLTREAAKARVTAEEATLPISVRLRRLVHGVREAMHARKPQRLAQLTAEQALAEEAQDTAAVARMLSIQESGQVIKALRSWTQLDAYGLYRALCADAALLKRLAPDTVLPTDIEEILGDTLEGMQEGRIAYEDGAALALLHVYLHGNRQYRDLKQVVVDEVQDYAPIHAILWRELFPQAHFTMLGDVHQRIGQASDPALYDRIADILAKPSAVQVTMAKSFRCTQEILRFSEALLAGEVAAESFNRSGDAPEVIAAQGDAELQTAILAEVSRCQTLGYASIALLCKSAQEARIWHARLRASLTLRLVEEDQGAALQGVLLLPVYLAKGLEFDAVLVLDADALHYADTAEDRQMLYVACSRALHRLTVLHQGAASSVLPGGKEEAHVC